MRHPHPAIESAVRALQGESNVDAVAHALRNWRLAQVIALAPDAHVTVRAIAALLRDLKTLPDVTSIAFLAFHDAVARIIEKYAKKSILERLAEIAPAGWERAHATELIRAVNNNTCSASAAAALIGPCDVSASLLRDPYNIARAIRRWGQSSPDDPSGWMHALSAGARNRLVDAVSSHPQSIARCLPWLPPDMANRSRVKDIDTALLAFAKASPTARAQHVDILQRLVAQTHTEHLCKLTRLACATESYDVWERVQTLIQESPDAAYHVVNEALWDDLAETVRTAILERADRSDICAAITAARGQHMVERITDTSAAAFFAALDPKVWDALPADEQRRRVDALPNDNVYLAVRSLGLRLEILAQASLTESLAEEAQRHERNADALRWTLLPVALHDVCPAHVHTLIAALPTLPPDPGAFFVIASKNGDPAVMTSARSVLHTPDRLARAVALQRCADRRIPIGDRCDGLEEALRGQTQHDLAPILPVLTQSARTMCMPMPSAMAPHLAHPDHCAALHETLGPLSRLPLAIAIPTFVALEQSTSGDPSDAADIIAHTLRAQSDVFLSLVDSVANARLRNALLPLPKWKPLAHALRHVAHDDPPTAQRLAYALRDRSWSDMLCVLLASPPQHAATIWRTLHPSTRSAIDKTLKTSGVSAAYGDMIAAVMRLCSATFLVRLRWQRCNRTMTTCATQA